MVDESLPVVLGTACPSNIPGCDALGFWTCGQGEVPVCVTDPMLCPPVTPSGGDSPSTGGLFTVPETDEEPPPPVTTTCASGTTPGAPMALLVLWLMARIRRRSSLGV